MTMPTKQTIAQAKYDAKNCKNYHFKLVIKSDKDIIDKLASVPSMQGYIKQLIRADIEGSSVPIPDAALSVLKEEAEKTGKSVPTLVSLIVNEHIVRNRK